MTVYYNTTGAQCYNAIGYCYIYVGCRVIHIYIYVYIYIYINIYIYVYMYNPTSYIYILITKITSIDSLFYTALKHLFSQEYRWMF